MFSLKTQQTALLSSETLTLYREHMILIITFCVCGSNDISIWISRYTKFKYQYQIGWAKWYRYNLKLCHESS